MFQNVNLVQNFSDQKMAELRRDNQARGARTSDVRHDLALRIVRPLRGWRAGR